VIPPDSRILGPTAAAAGFVNHLLRGAGWAREALRRFAGRTARFELDPFTLSLTITDAGEVTPAAVDAASAATVRLTPGLMLRIAARDDSAWREIALSGDGEFAACLHHVARNLRWDIEEDLSRVFGDVPAHRMVRTGRALQDWGEQALENTGRSFAEYWTEEQPLIAAGRDLAEFNRSVSELRDDLARLEKRVEYLLGRRAARGGA
jgi:ubiquinone biosynthesis accessory factor UbiJ